MSGWTALRIPLPEEGEEQLLHALSEAGTIGVEILDGTEPPEPRASAGDQPDPPKPRVSAGDLHAQGGGRSAIAYFATRIEAETALGLIGTPTTAALSSIEDERWVERQEAGRRPMPVGRRFLIVPGEKDLAEGRDERVVILVPPRRAFGTGEHPTTRLCVEALETSDVQGRRVLDFGTGSGILAMAACALGATEVLGLDIDPEAVEMARANAEINAPAIGAARLEFRTGGADAIQGTFDLIVGNIFARVLERAAPALAAHHAAGGRAILSGIASEEAAEVAACFAAHGYSESGRTEEAGWAALVLVKSE